MATATTSCFDTFRWDYNPISSTTAYRDFAVMPYCGFDASVYRNFYLNINLWVREYSTQSDISGGFVMSNSSNSNITCTVNEFEFQGKVYKLQKEIELQFVFNNGYYSAHFEPLDIYITEQTFEEALKSFYEEIDMLWKEYVLEDENVLSIDARNLKKRVMDLVERVR